MPAQAPTTADAVTSTAPALLNDAFQCGPDVSLALVEKVAQAPLNNTDILVAQFFGRFDPCSRVKASRKFIRGGGAVTDLFQIVSRMEQVGGTLALEGDRIRYSIPSGDTSRVCYWLNVESTVRVCGDCF